MNEATPAQKACIHALVKKLGWYHQRASMICGLTNGRTESVADLTKDEATFFIKHLKENDPEERQAEVMRRKIISMAHEMKWELPGGKADMQGIDAWMVKSSYLHKKIKSI